MLPTPFFGIEMLHLVFLDSPSTTPSLLIRNPSSVPSTLSRAISVLLTTAKLLARMTKEVKVNYVSWVSVLFNPSDRTALSQSLVYRVAKVSWYST